MPATQTLRVSPAAVSPTGSDVGITPDHKGNGSYTPVSVNAAPATGLAPATLSVLMPQSFSTSTASLSAGAMFAAQLMAQDAGAGELLETYEALARASEVKYMPSNAQAPQPAPMNLFAKMMNETQNQNIRVSQQVQQVMQETMQQAPPVQAQVKAPASFKFKPGAAQGSASEIRHASHAYQATSARNSAVLDEKPVEAVSELEP